MGRRGTSSGKQRAAPMNNHRRKEGERGKFREKKYLKKARESKVIARQVIEVEAKTNLSRIIIVVGVILLIWAMVFLLPAYLHAVRQRAKPASARETTPAPATP